MRDKSGGKGPCRDAAKERFWRRMIKKLDREGVTVRAFCQKHEIAEHQFYSWRREIKRRDREINLSTRAKKEGDTPSAKRKQREDEARSIFTPVTIIADGAAQVAPISGERGLASPTGQPAQGPIEVVLDEITVRVPPATTRESLEMVLSALDVLGQS